MEKDDRLKENIRIELAIEQLQKVPSQEMLAHTLTVLRRRMKEGGELIPALDQNAGMNSLQMRVLRTEDGRSWFLAFTSFEEELKGADTMKSTFLSDIGKLFQTALTVPEIEGIIINPWNRTIMLDKKLIRIIMPYN